MGTRNNTNQITSIRYFEPNNSLNAVTNAANPFSPQDQSAYNLFFDNSLDGTGVIKESVVQFGGGGNVTSNSAIDFIRDNEGHIVAENGPVVNSAGQSTTVLQITANPVSAFNVSTLINQATSVTIQPGDSWVSVSYRAFQDPNVGLRKQLDIKLVLEQAAAQLIDAKIDLKL